MRARSHSNDSRSIVLGTAMGYTPDQIRPFTRSLRGSGYQGDVTLVVDRSTAAALRNDDDHADVDLVVAPFWFPMKHRLLGRSRRMAAAAALLLPGWAVMRVLARFRLTRRLARSLATFVVPPTESRFVHYLRILRGSSYQRVLITDVRDVVFQVDPFEALTCERLAVGMEAEHLRLGDEPWNVFFVERAYGRRMLDRMRHERVSCSGVTYGPRSAMLRYLSLMSDEVIRLRFRATLQPLDQGLHNKLLWTGDIADFEPLEVFDSALATLHPDHDQEITVDDEGFIVNRDGSRVAILHQYNRLPRWKDHLLERLTR